MIGDLVVLGFIILFVVLGYRSGFFNALVDFFKFFLPFLIAMTFYEFLAPLVGMIPLGMGDPVRDAVAFTILFGGGAYGLQQLIMFYLPEEGILLPTPLDKLGGIVCGGATGALCGGVFLILWSMLGTTSLGGLVKIDYDNLKLPVGRILAEQYQGFAKHAGSPEGREFRVKDELFEDANENGVRDEGEEYRDANLNDQWDRGFLDKYRKAIQADDEEEVEEGED